ncbi:MAG: hypothetical protein ABWX94_01235 [Candidatus Saccharimonadales bacterium]
MAKRPQEHLDFLDQIKPIVRTYEPAISVTTHAQRARVLAVVGPAGIGKNTLMAASGLHIATSVTSRPRRDTDTTIRHYHDFTKADDRRYVLTRLDDRSFIQIISHPATGEMYASEPEDYPLDTISLWDATATEYQRVRKANIFGSLLNAYIVTPTYEQWQEQWLGRTNGDRPDDYIGRMVEAHNSLTISLRDPETTFMLNTDVEESGLVLRGIAFGKQPTLYESDAARAAAYRLLDGIAESGVQTHKRTL